MKRKTFFEWLNQNQKILEATAKHAVYRPEIKDLKMLPISLNDIIELGPETTLRGVKVNRLARVVEIKRNHVEALDLSKNDGSRIIIPIDHLYEKRELTGIKLKPKEERDLAAIGAKNLWVKLTPRQYAKYKSSYREPEPISFVPNEPEIDDDQVKFLRNWFKNAKAADDEQEVKKTALDIFGSKSQEDEPSTGVSPEILRKPSPLSRFIRKKNEE